MPRHAIGSLGALIALGALAACGGTTSTGGTQTTTSTTPTVTSATVALHHVPTGQATLAYNTATKSLTVELNLTGLAPGSTHPAHIHSGLCEKQGAVLYPLNPIVADAKGVADSVTVVPNIAEGGIPNGTWYVNVHNGPGLSPNSQFEPIVCGDVANTNKGTFEVVKLTDGPTPATTPFFSSADQTASGTANLSITAGSLEVMIDVSGLEPSSSHAVHIHKGSCASQGAVVHALPPLTADATGHATLSATVTGVSAIPEGVWYLNIHRVTTIATGQTDFDPILCGDIGGSSGY